MNLLTRYWFSFDVPPFYRRNVGVTAYSFEDAISLIEQRVFPRGTMPTILDVIEDIDVSTLDEGRILPNIGPPNFRGVWHPNLLSYDP